MGSLDEGGRHPWGGLPRWTEPSGEGETPSTVAPRKLRVLACTSAFGMGIDQPDVRWVYHAGPPANLEAYTQEAGRAGRDGKEARCVLYVGPEDIQHHKRPH